MIDVKYIKSLLTQELVEQIISAQGFEVRNHKFKIRDEHTSSVSVSPKCYIKDFGGTFGGDIFTFLRDICGFSFKNAVECVANFVGYTGQCPSYQNSYHPQAQSQNKPAAILNEVASRLRLGFVQNKQKVISQLGTLFHPNFFKFFGTDKIEKFVGFCERKQVFGYMFSDDNGVVKTIAYNQRTEDRKWIREKGSTNSLLIKNINEEDEVILIAEGISEPLIFELLGLSYICFQNADEMKKVGKNGDFFQLKSKLRDKRLYIIADNDDIGLEASEKVASCLKNVAKSIYITQFTNYTKGFDMRDLILKIAGETGSKEAFEEKLKIQILKNSKEITWN